MHGIQSKLARNWLRVAWFLREPRKEGICALWPLANIWKSYTFSSGDNLTQVQQVMIYQQKGHGLSGEAIKACSTPVSNASYVIVVIYAPLTISKLNLESFQSMKRCFTALLQSDRYQLKPNTVSNGWAVALSWVCDGFEFTEMVARNSPPKFTLSRLLSGGILILKT